MKIFSKNIINGWLEEEFGANAQDKSFFVNNINTKSFHIGWNDLPKDTKDIAIVFDDYDAIPVCGFTWIHWIVTNIDPNSSELPINAANDDNRLNQGKNSWSSPLFTKDVNNDLYQKFGGCAPPDKDHEYRVTIYALDKKMELPKGYMLNDLIKAMNNHILDSVEIKFKYHKVI